MLPQFAASGTGHQPASSMPCRYLGRQAAATLRATSSDDRSATAGGHTGAKAVRALATQVAGLESLFHGLLPGVAFTSCTRTRRITDGLSPVPIGVVNDYKWRLAARRLWITFTNSNRLFPEFRRRPALLQTNNKVRCTSLTRQHCRQ